MSHAFKLHIAAGLPIHCDIHVPEGDGPFPIIVGCHGFKSFKDWGWYPALGDFFASQNIAFVRFNHSLNGVEEDFLNFTNLDNFGKNTVSQEQEDIKIVVDAIYAGTVPQADKLDTSSLTLIGHSRGGGNSIIYATGDKRVDRIVVIASVSSFSRTWIMGLIELWKRDGVIYVENGRTRQSMPLYYSLCEDVLSHKDRYNVVTQAGLLTCPVIVVHGNADTSVPITEGESIAKAAGVDVQVIDGAEHTFGVKHPFEGFTPHFDELKNMIVKFVK